MPTTTIHPNQKYDTVFGTNYEIDDDDTPRGRILREEYEKEYDSAVESYHEAIDNSPTVEEAGEDPAELDGLTWNDVSVPKDPDLVSMMATYFTGVTPREPRDLIRAKLRLVDVEHMANAQISSKAELRGETVSRHNPDTHPSDVSFLQVQVWRNGDVPGTDDPHEEVGFPVHDGENYAVDGEPVSIRGHLAAYFDDLLEDARANDCDEYGDADPT